MADCAEVKRNLPVVVDCTALMLEIQYVKEYSYALYKRYIKENSIWVLVYIGLGIFNSFVANYKVDYFQKVIDGLADRTLAFAGVATYGLFCW